MNEPLEFLRSTMVEAALERASQCAGTPLSLHYVQRNQEGPRIQAWGACAACKSVTSSPEGVHACRVSRTTASVMALRQQRPIPFVCHMGFACVSVPALPGEDYVATLGPYCPMEEQRSLESDIRAGWSALHGEEDEELPFSLDDIHRAPASAVPAVAQWLQEDLAVRWHAREQPDGEPNAPSDRERVTGVPSARTGTTTDRFLTLARNISAALAGGSHAQARALILGDLEESGSPDRAVRNARAAAVTGATLEALGRAGVPLGEAWPRFQALSGSLATLQDDRELLEQVMGVFSYLRRKAVVEAQENRLPHYPALYAIVKDHLLDGITLEQVAAELQETPSAISHRLKRKFGMSFSEYMGRIRIERAKQLLRRSKLSATEIARRVGIADQSNFSKLFKKLEGVSPSEYKRKYGKGL